ncbi:colicin E5-related ribonuclease [Rhodoblastus sp.]|uniref:colicin E5-related ribonuclease n=1 Tax=Rhodoblastus sp. TaxID=1962975 RepID=UPI0035AFFF45
MGHNGGPALDQAGDRQSRDRNERDPYQKPEPSIAAPLSSSGSGDDSSSQQSGNEATATNNADFVVERKIADQMSARGWTSDSIRSTLSSPAKTIPARGTRFDDILGVRRDDPATAYVNTDGSYVVVNDTDRTVVQLSDRNDPDWRAPWAKGSP